MQLTLVDIKSETMFTIMSKGCSANELAEEIAIFDYSC
jgi:hypothetical protein